jgi:hypothetical protein
LTSQEKQETLEIIYNTISGIFGKDSFTLRELTPSKMDDSVICVLEDFKSTNIILLFFKVPTPTEVIDDVREGYLINCELDFNIECYAWGAIEEKENEFSKTYSCDCCGQKNPVGQTCMCNCGGE